ncbi:MAG: hypothetical protein ACRDKZ_09990 [Actinomycetota bacterium]
MSLSGFFLVALAAAWVAVLVPAMVRARHNTPLGSSERFRRGLQVIAPPAYGGSGRWVVVPRQGDRRVRTSYRDVQRRRSRLLMWMVLVSLATAGIALWRTGWWWEIHIGFDLVLGLYVVALLETKRRRAERVRKVRPLIDERRAPSSERGRRAAAGR